jgi:hypothetical protein
MDNHMILIIMVEYLFINHKIVSVVSLFSFGYYDQNKKAAINFKNQFQYLILKNFNILNLE